jgi:hypothetical protein
MNTRPIQLVKIVPNRDGRTFRPYTSGDECVMRSFGAHDESDPNNWTLEEYKAFSRKTGIRFMMPAPLMRN